MCYPLFWFLTPKGYLIIVFMMTLGFTLRGIGKLPGSFLAFIYTGLGSALSMAGLLFLARFVPWLSASPAFIDNKPDKRY